MTITDLVISSQPTQWSFNRGRMLLALTVVATNLDAHLVAQTTRRVSLHDVGGESHRCDGGGLSRDGSAVVLLTHSVFVPGGPPSWTQVYLSTLADTAEWHVSRSPTGVPSNGYQWCAAVSADGRTVVFGSEASNLSPQATIAGPRLYVADSLSPSVELISSPQFGVVYEPNDVCISDDGQVLAFRTPYALTAADANWGPDVYKYDRATGQLTLESLTMNGGSLDYTGWPGQSMNSVLRPVSMSSDGSVVAYSCAVNQISPQDTNWWMDVYVRDSVTDTTELISVGPSGQILSQGGENSTISGDGRFVAFASWSAEWLFGVPVTSEQLWLRDRVAGTTELITYNSSGGVSQGGVTGARAAISSDGRFVAFASNSADFVPGDTNGRTDVFVRDRVLGTTTRVSMSSSNSQILGDDCFLTGMSGDGSRVAFQSRAPDIVPGDTNGNDDLFVRDLAAPLAPIAGYCAPSTSSAGCVPSIATAGEPDTSGNTAFFVTSVNAPANRLGALAWSFGPSAPSSWSSSLCLASPIRVLARKSSSSSASTPAACSGWFSYELTPALMSAHNWTSGSTLHAQFFVRDPAAATGLARSSALQISLY